MGRLRGLHRLTAGNVWQKIGKLAEPVMVFVYAVGGRWSVAEEKAVAGR